MGFGALSVGAKILYATIGSMVLGGLTGGGKGMIKGMIGASVAGATMASLAGSAGAGPLVTGAGGPTMSQPAGSIAVQATSGGIHPAYLTPAPATAAAGKSILGTVAGAIKAVAPYAQAGASVYSALKGPPTITMPSVESIAPIDTGPTAVELEAQRVAEEAEKAKLAAEARTAEIEAGIEADTAAALKKKRSIVGSLSSTIKTSSRGLLGRAPIEKKTLLGQGGYA